MAARRGKYDEGSAGEGQDADGQAEIEAEAEAEAVDGAVVEKSLERKERCRN